MNPALLQKQIKENANDLQEFCKDLKNWGEEMKRKENCLKKNDEDTKKIKVLDEGSLPKAKKLSKEKDSRRGATDYSKWEKFDADLECDRLEEDIKDDSELTDEIEEDARDEALVHKDKGNSYVKTKEWDKAIECYTKAIQCYSYDPIFYANRALCYLKKANFVAAEKDCNLALKLDSTYVKALQRRAAARECLGKLDLAEIDLETVLSYEPKNKESKAALENVRKKLGHQNKQEAKEDEQRPISKFTASRSKLQNVSTASKATSSVQVQKPNSSQAFTSASTISSWPDVKCEIIPVKTVKKPPHLRSKKPLRRIEITEVDSVSNAELNIIKNKKVNPIVPEAEAVKRHVVEHVRKEEVTPIGDNFTKSVTKASAFKKNREEVEICSKENGISNILTKSAAIKEVVENTKKVKFDEKTQTIECFYEPDEKTSEFKKRREHFKNEEITDKPRSTAWPKPNEDNHAIKSDDLKIVENKSVNDSNPKDIKNTENLFITKMDMKNTNYSDVNEEKEKSDSTYPVPKTSVQFCSVWKNLKDTDRFRYLKLIEPTQIPKIFLESMESNVFSSILEILSTEFIDKNEALYEYLISLTSVKRFSALTMFMDSSDKNRLWKIITYLREKEKRSKEEVDYLVCMYEL